MRRTLLLVAWMPLAAFGDDHRISFLEQEVRNLQRQVQSLSRQVDELSRPARPDRRVVAKPATPAMGASDRWVDARKWDALRTGMSELEVIGLLGAPTTMREEGGARLLFYALEIGSSGFLGGSITLRDRTVTEIRRPTLQ
jgi:hypothetical protein